MGFGQPPKTIKAERNVRVERCRDESGQVFFRKHFAPWLGKDGWPQRENRILLHLLARQEPYPKGLVRPYGSLCDPSGRVDTIVETYDAGRSIKDWKNIAVRSSKTGLRLDQPFHHCLHWWALLEATLNGLSGLHREGFVHLDIKEDNVCIPAKAGSNGSVSLEFESVCLIDVTFSLLATLPLERALPLTGDSTYQSPALIQAIDMDSQSGFPDEANKLDWHVDLFSLGSMMERLLGGAKDSPNSGWNLVLIARAEEIIEQLQKIDRVSFPHQDLLTKVRNVLSSLDRSDCSWILDEAIESVVAAKVLIARRSWMQALPKKLSLSGGAQILIVLSSALIIFMLLAQSLRD
jgi:serine/threonine protein kinase